MTTQEIELPRDGILFRDVVRFTNMSMEEFAEACPYPFLLQVPVEGAKSADGRDTTARLPKAVDPFESSSTLAVEAEDILSLVRSKSKGASEDVLLHMIYPQAKGGGVLVGRKDSGADVQIDNSTVSKRHAEMNTVKNVWRVVDLGSSNGTFVDGKRLDPGILSLVRDRGDIRFGTYRAFFLSPKTLYKLIETMK